MKLRKKQHVLRFLLLTFLIFVSSFISAHPFYVSICEMNYNKETKSLEISLRVFTDDLEKTLQDWSAEKLYLGEKNESANSDILLKKYILNVLGIALDEKNIPLHFVGKEIEQALTWIYLETKNTADFDKIEVENRMLFQSFPTQTNLIHVNNKGEIKSLLLTKNNPAGELNWD